MPLATALRDLPSWLDYLCRVEVPVLPATVTRLGELALLEDDVDAHSIADVVARDPMMSAKLYRHIASLRRDSQATDIETLNGCVVMMGVPPFFRTFGNLPRVTLPDDGSDDAPQGLSAVLSRASRARDFAMDWAIRRNDLDVEVIGTAALLHDFAEMLMWCHAPALALEVREAQRRDPARRSAASQQAVLGIELADLQQALMKSWRLPELLIRISDDRHAEQPGVKNVALAIRLARHTANGWDNPAIPDDVGEIATLLNLSKASTLQLLMNV